MFFWIWTNLGVWLLATIYPLNIQGLSACYIAAIPFLMNSLIGTAAGYALLKLSDAKIDTKCYTGALKERL